MPASVWLMAGFNDLSTTRKSLRHAISKIYQTKSKTSVTLVRQSLEHQLLEHQLQRWLLMNHYNSTGVIQSCFQMPPIEVKWYVSSCEMPLYRSGRCLRIQESQSRNHLVIMHIRHCVQTRAICNQRPYKTSYFSPKCNWRCSTHMRLG